MAQTSSRFFTESSLGEKRAVTPEGFLVVQDVPIAKTGDMLYMPEEVPAIEPEGGRVVLYRTEYDLFDPDTIASFEGKPLIIPPETSNGHAFTVVPETWADHAVGHVQNIRRDGDMLVADIVIHDSDAIERVNNGLRELSCGYDAMLEQEGRGKARQRGIIGNHVALVQRARGGRELRIGDTKPSTEVSKMSKLSFLGKAFAHAIKAGDEDTAAEIEEKMKEKDGKETEGDEEPDNQAAENARFDKLEARIDQLFQIIEQLTKKDETESSITAGDSDVTAGDSEWQELASGAEVLSPGFTVDKKAPYDKEMRRALGDGLQDSPEARAVIGDKLPEDPVSLAMAFKAAVALKKASNKSKVMLADTAPSSFTGFDNGGFTVIR